MNTNLLCKESEEIKGKINIIPYQINTDGLYPFLQYFLLKYTNQDNVEEIKDDLVSFIKFDHNNDSNILDICAAALDILFLSYEELESKYIYDGYLFYEEEYYLFFNCSEYNIPTHNLNKQNDIWLVLIDEIVNYKIVCQYQIDDKVSNFFINNTDYITLTNEDGNQYESPIVAYIGCNIKKRDFISTFGQIPNNDGYYSFTEFNDVYIDTKNTHSALIRVAIFPGNMQVRMEVSQSIQEDLIQDENITIEEDVDSIYLDKRWILNKHVS